MDRHDLQLFFEHGSPKNRKALKALSRKTVERNMHEATRQGIDAAEQMGTKSGEGSSTSFARLRKRHMNDENG